MVDFKFREENNDKRCDQHARARNKRKNLSPREELNLRPSVHRSDILTTELRWACGELGHIQIHHTNLENGLARTSPS